MFSRLTKFIDNNKNIILKTLLLLFFIFGVFTSQKVGIAWDEFTQREGIGLPVYKYVLDNNESYLRAADRNYGPVFEFILIFIEKVFNIKDFASIFRMRHLMNFLVFFVGVILFYKIAFKKFKSWKYAFISALFLVLSPRILGDSFYNSKDLVFLSFFILSIYTLLKLEENLNFKSLIIHALAGGVLIDIRILGCIIIPITLLFLFSKILLKEIKTYNFISYLILYLLFTSLFVYIFMPLLWRDPINNFINIIKQMSKYPWNGGVLFMGKIFGATELPKYYLPLWIFISTPLLYTFLFIVGLFTYFKKLFINIFKKNFKYIWANYFDNILVLWIFIPILIVIILNSVVYDSWRHVFFIYPAIILMAVIGLRYLIENFYKYKKLVTSIKILSIISILYTVSFILISFPHFNVYFNPIMSINAEKWIEKKFELDYWGLAYKQGLEYILKNDNSEVINIKVDINPGPGTMNKFAFYEKDRKRINYVENLQDADYFIAGFRTKKDRYDDLKEYYSITLYNNLEILTIYK